MMPAQLLEIRIETMAARVEIITLPARSNGYRTGWWRIRVEGKEFEVFKSLPEKMPLMEIEEVLAKALEKKVCVLRESVEPN